MNKAKSKQRALDLMVLGLAVSTVSILVPGIFREDITISPLVLVGIVFFANLSPVFVPDKTPDAVDRVFSLRFFARLALSGLFTLFLVALPALARMLV